MPDADVFPVVHILAGIALAALVRWAGVRFGRYYQCRTAVVIRIVVGIIAYGLCAWLVLFAQ